MKKFLAEGWTLGVVFHAPKGYSGDRQIVDMISGSSVLVRFPENVIAILPHAKEKTARVVDCSVLRDYPPPDPFSVKLDNGALIPVPDLAPELRGMKVRSPKTAEEREAEKVEQDRKRAEKMRVDLSAILEKQGAELLSCTKLCAILRRKYPKRVVEDFIKECREDGELITQGEFTRSGGAGLAVKPRRDGGRVLISTPEWVEAYRREWGAPQGE